MRELKLTFLMVLLFMMAPAILSRVVAHARDQGKAAATTGSIEIARNQDGQSEQDSLLFDPEDFHRLSDIGRGRGVIFSPDLSLTTNRGFYERLGFAYFEDPDWRVIIKEVLMYNRIHRDLGIKELVIESHGTDGNGLKLQQSHEPHARRSYISVGALREMLEGSGVRICVITACNAGRLFRPQIYRVLNRHTNNPLFLPATLGIVNGSVSYRPTPKSVRIVYPARSGLETANYGDTTEFSSVTRSVLNLENFSHGRPPATPANGVGFVISDIMVQLLLRDPTLELKSDGYVDKISHSNFTNEESEELYQKFLGIMERVAQSEYRANQLPGPPNEPLSFTAQ